MTDHSTLTEQQLSTAIYDSLAAFAGVACWNVLQYAQNRQYLAEHLTEALAPMLPEVQRAYEQRLREQHDRDVAEVNRLRARLWELERPAVEAKRNEIRQSYAELVAAAEETKDFEGAFDVQCRLREREEQWARIDAASSGQPAALPASLTATTPPTAYSDGKGRVFCLKCAPAIGADVALTANDVQVHELCPSCGRHVIDVACGEA